MENKTKNFLQSTEWRKFQENTGKRTFFIEKEGSASSAYSFSASLIEHSLPIVGNYFYCPRGPIFSAEAERIPNSEFRISNEFPTTNDQISNGFKISASPADRQNSKFKIDFSELLEITRKNNAGWIRIDPEDENVLNLIKENTDYKIVRAPHDMQPKEIFVIDIAKSEEELLAEMKSKTRYNIKIAQKNVAVSVSREKKYVEEFLKLTKETAKRNGITSHPEKYYRKMIESLPEDMLKIYVAEYENKIIAANLMLFYGDTATYLHGASGNEHRNVMAPYLLQWQAILDAKEKGYLKYDFGGVKSEIPNSKFQISNYSDWSGITKFKLGFSPNTQPLEFPGSYDIIVNSLNYWIYIMLQKIKELLVKIGK